MRTGYTKAREKCVYSRDMEVIIKMVAFYISVVSRRLSLLRLNRLICHTA